MIATEDKQLGTKAYLLHLYRLYKEGVFEQPEIIKLLTDATLDEENVKTCKIKGGRQSDRIVYEVCIESAINTVTIDLNLEQADQSLLMFRKALIKNVKDD